MEISSSVLQSHVTSEPEHVPVSGTQTLSEPTRIAQNASDWSEQGPPATNAGIDNFNNAILSMLSTIFSKMEFVNDSNYKSIIQRCLSIGSLRPVLIDRRGRCMILRDRTCFLIWFEDDLNTRKSDFSPSQRVHSIVDDLSGSKGDILSADYSFPVVVNGPILRSEDKQFVFGCLVLLPFGNIRSNESIRSAEVFKAERCLIACILSTDHLLLASESGPDERSPLASVSFNIDSLLPLDALKSPATVHIWANGSRIFVTDNRSDLVLEFRFDYSLVDQNRGCPDFSLIHWYLESAVPIGPNTRVTLVGSEDTPSIQVIGLNNNGDSQGVVRLCNQRRWLTPNTSSSAVTSILTTTNSVLVNSTNYLKLVGRDTGPDFPLLVRPSAINIALLPDGIFLSLYAGIVTAFRVSYDTGTGVVAPVSVSGLTECVDSLAIDPFKGERAVIIVHGDPAILRLYQLNFLRSENVVQFAFASQHSLPSPISCLSINQFGEWVGYSEIENKINHNFAPLAVIAARMKDHFIDSIALCDDWFSIVSITHEHRNLDIYALHDPTKPVSQFQLDSSFLIHSLRFERIVLQGDHPCLVLYGISGHVGILCRDYLKGTWWDLVQLPNQHRDSLCVLCNTSDQGRLDAFFVETQSPFRVYESSIESLPIRRLDPIIHCLSACLYGEQLRSEISWALLPEKLRSIIEPLVVVEKFPDVSRSTDNACRRFLIEWHFSQEYPDLVYLTTEALAWASVSETQSYVVQQVVGDLQTGCSWEKISKSGLGFWCNELGQLKTLVESIQKSALQEYMKSKDADILENRVALWLSVLGKQQLLSSLYKQYGNSCASSVHVKVGEFLATDFSQPENTTKATKNAFELLRQKRYFLAVSMFILGGSYREALDVCCRQLNDIQLALLLAKVLKMNGGNRTERDQVLDTLIEYLWAERILPYSDPWMALIQLSSRMDWEGIVGLVTDGMSSVVKLGEQPEITSFASPKFPVTVPSAIKLAQTVQERMRRYNRLCEAEVPQFTAEQTASCYLSRGLGALAKILIRNSSNKSDEYLARAIELEISH